MGSITDSFVPAESHMPMAHIQLYDKFQQMCKGRPDEYAYPTLIKPHVVMYVTANKVGNSLRFDSHFLKFPTDGSMTEAMIQIIGKINFTARTLGIPGVPKTEQ